MRKTLQALFWIVILLLIGIEIASPQPIGFFESEKLVSGIEDGAISIDYMTKLLIAILLSIVGFMVTTSFNRVNKTQDKLTETVTSFNAEIKLLRQSLVSIDRDNSEHYRRINRISNWINEHILIHAQCQSCGPVNKYYKKEKPTHEDNF